MNYDELAKKKAELDQYRPFSAAFVSNMESWFRVELTYTSNAIEGNTLTRQETALVLEKGITVGGKSIREHIEATNHAKALGWVRDFASKGAKAVSEADLLHIHKLILSSIDDANAGRYRDIHVRLAGSGVVLPNHRKIPELMKSFFARLEKSSLHPLELAVEAHYELVTIHPFVDGNGRTGRLLMNLILMMHGYPSAIIRPEDRLAYINSLEKAQLTGSKEDYAKFMLNAIDRSLDIYLQALNE